MAARAIFGELGRGGWLSHTLPSGTTPGAIDLRGVCLLRECSAYASAHGSALYRSI
jgi:hypothetical protein